MKLTRLAGLQKRCLDWDEFFNAGGCPNAEIKTTALGLLQALRKLILVCWESKEMNAEQAELATDLESKIESVAEECRLYVGGNTPLRKEKTFAGGSKSACCTQEH